MLRLNKDQIPIVNKYALVNLKNLEDLYLNENRIVFVEADLFHDCTKLKVLNLVNNEIERFDAQSLSLLVSLEFFHFYSNRLHAIESNTFPRCLDKLRKLNLSKFHLMTIDVNALANLGSS